MQTPPLEGTGGNLFPSDTLSPWGNAELHPHPCPHPALWLGASHLWPSLKYQKSESATGEDPMSLGTDPLHWVKWELFI